MDVHCERCGTSYSLEEARLGPAGARVRCARCGHVFLAPRPPSPPGAGPAPAPPAAESLRRAWRVRRRNGSLSSLRELTTLQRWIVEGKLSPEDEVGLDGETWRVLGTIPDLQVFFTAAAAVARLAALEAEGRTSPPAADVPKAPSVADAPPTLEPPRPAAPPVSTAAAQPAAPQSPSPPISTFRPTRLRSSAEEPAFTKGGRSLGVAEADDWEPPRLKRGIGGWLLLFALFLLAAGGAWAYVYLWRPEMQRASAEQARNGQLEREQADHEARQKAAEQRAKDELLSALTAAAALDGGAAPSPDAGTAPHGLLGPSVPAVPVPSLAAPALPASAIAPAPQASGAPSAAAVVRAGPQTFEEWMAEATRRRTHERAASALAAYDKALALQPLSAEAHSGRALALLDLGRRHEALFEFNQALELDPQSGVAVLGLAETYRSLGRVQEARAAYQRYLEGWPHDPEARAARAALESLKD